MRHFLPRRRGLSTSAPKVHQGISEDDQRNALASDDGLNDLLGTARCNVHSGFGFGDVVAGPAEAQLPTLINRVPAPVLLTYPQVSVIAEKFEAMVQLGTGNSRMKDFYDVWALSETFAFEGPSLRDAVARCFDRRGTPWNPELPEALTSAFYSNTGPQNYWMQYGRQEGVLRPPPGAFEEIGNRIQSFLGPVESIRGRRVI